MLGFFSWNGPDGRRTVVLKQCSIFLYGDHSGMYHRQVAELLNPSLGPMPIVYGINNGAVLD
jgi:hypothetical protein